MVTNLIVVMLMEFIIIHSAALFGGMLLRKGENAQKVKWLIGRNYSAKNLLKKGNYLAHETHGKREMICFSIKEFCDRF